jgi:hypothetical protein
MKAMISQVQEIDEGECGFILFDDRGVACATFKYSSGPAAQEAADCLAKALACANSVAGAERETASRP